MTNDASGGGDDTPPSFGNGGPGDGPRSIDVLFDSMASRRARHVLSYLRSASKDVVTLEELVNRLTEREMADGLASDSEDHRQHVAIALHHNHLPKLSDAALLDYDPRSKMVRHWNDDRVVAVLELAESDD